MNEQPFASPIESMAIDALPVTCEKYGLEQISDFIGSCVDCGIPPLETFVLVEMFFPLNEEEMAREAELVKRNLQAMFLINPELKADYDEVSKSVDGFLASF